MLKMDPPKKNSLDPPPIEVIEEFYYGIGVQVDEGGDKNIMIIRLMK